MDSIASQVGIDVSGSELVVCIDTAKPFVVLNSDAGCDVLVPRLPCGCVVHVEASGGYERLVCRRLRKEGYEVRLHDPLKAKRLAQARGKRAKTDAVDARELSLNGPLLPQRQAKSQTREDLTDLSRAIGALQEMASQTRKRQGMPGLDQDAKKALGDVAAYIEKKIVSLEKRFLARLKRDPELTKKYRMVKSIPAVGPKLARVCLCELPENTLTQTAEQIASFAGLAPIDDQSGKRNGNAHIGRGNDRLKGALYMPAMCAIRNQTWAKDTYAKLRAKGRSHRQAAVAVMRKLLVRIVAVLHRGEPWQDQLPIKQTTKPT